MMNVFSRSPPQAFFSEDDILTIFDTQYGAHVENLSCVFKFYDVCTYMHTDAMACIHSLN